MGGLADVVDFKNEGLGNFMDDDEQEDQEQDDESDDESDDENEENLATASSSSDDDDDDDEEDILMQATTGSYESAAQRKRELKQWRALQAKRKKLEQRLRDRDILDGNEDELIQLDNEAGEQTTYSIDIPGCVPAPRGITCGKREFLKGNKCHKCTCESHQMCVPKGDDAGQCKQRPAWYSHGDNVKQLLAIRAMYGDQMPEVTRDSIDRCVPIINLGQEL